MSYKAIALYDPKAKETYYLNIHQISAFKNHNPKKVDRHDITTGKQTEIVAGNLMHVCSGTPEQLDEAIEKALKDE